MAKLVIMRGLPASGKSTRVAEMIRASGNAIRVNGDLLREMLHFGKFTGPNEGVTQKIARAIAKQALGLNKTVIVDNTSLNPGTLESWKDLAKECGAQVEVIEVDTPLDECLRRDRSREKRVGDHVIIGMAMQYGKYPTPKNGIVIVDLDGTLCDISHRRHLVAEKPKNWPAFFAGISGDSVRRDVLDMVLAHEAQGREIFFVSGRPDTYREVTEAWLERELKGVRLHRALFMRKGHDSRDDTIIKREIYEAYFQTFDVVEVIDDRPRVIVGCWIPLLGKGRVRDVGNNADFVEEREALNYWTIT